MDPRGEAEFKRHLDEWDRQLREIRTGKRACLDTWNQLAYDLRAMTRDEQDRVQLHCKLGTSYNSLGTSESLDPELLQAYAAWPDSDHLRSEHERSEVIAPGVHAVWTGGHSRTALMDSGGHGRTAGQ